MLFNDAFQVNTPWAIARYCNVPLQRGWWTFESDGDDEDTEIRIRDDAGLIFAYRPARSGKMNLRLGVSATVEIDLIVSAWPGHRGFRKLSFRRLDAWEVARFFARRGAQTLRGEKPLARVTSAARLMLSRNSFGARGATAAASRGQGQQINAAASMAPSNILRSGDITYVMDADAVLDIRTLDLVNRTFLEQPHISAIYGDALEGGTVIPTPQWNDELAKWTNYCGLPVFFRDVASELTAENAWSHLKEIAERSNGAGVHRLPLPLAVRENRSTPSALPRPPMPMRSEWPRVTAIIPTKYRIDLLEKCLDGLIAQTGYSNLAVVIVDNGSEDPCLGDVLKRAASRIPLEVVRDAGDFNFSRLINGGARVATGDVLLLLNDDVRPVEPGWLHRIVDSVLDPSVGAVGARLLYASGAIQHAGIMLGLGGVCGHLWRHASPDEAERNPYIVYPGQRMAVTGACLAVRRDVFNIVGGLDEKNFPVTLNDVDFCLRLHSKGFKTIYRGDAILLHDEGRSRGSDDDNQKKRARRRGETSIFRSVWGSLIDADPFGSPAFDHSTEEGVSYAPVPLTKIGL